MRRYGAMRKRIVALLLMVAGFMLAMAALAAKPAPTREECLAVQRALNEGERLTGQQEQLRRRFVSLGECIAASEG
jgi:hypothetical protein